MPTNARFDIARVTRDPLAALLRDWTADSFCAVWQAEVTWSAEGQMVYPRYIRVLGGDEDAESDAVHEGNARNEGGS